MIIKVSAFVEVEGHLDEPKIFSEIVSRELSDYLTSKGVKLKGSVRKEILESNPKFKKETFLNHKQVLEKLRLSK